MKADYQRAEQLFNEKLGAKQDFEMKKYVYDAQVAAIAESQARVVQAKAQREQTAAQLASAQRQIAQSKANLTRFDDILRKHNAYAPIDGVVTNLPVRMGESVVPGIQNSEGSTIMTIADMSVITAEVKVDETDIVNIQLGPGGRYHHRRHSQQGLQRPRHGNRQHSHSAIYRRGRFAERDFEPGSQGFQGRHRHG